MSDEHSDLAVQHHTIFSYGDFNFVPILKRRQKYFLSNMPICTPTYLVTNKYLLTITYRLGF